MATDAATRDESSSGGEVAVHGVRPVPVPFAARARYAHLTTVQAVRVAIGPGTPPPDVFVELGRRMERGAIRVEAVDVVMEAIVPSWTPATDVYVELGRCIERGDIADNDGAPDAGVESEAWQPHSEVGS
jgi:hypothetical protein